MLSIFSCTSWTPVYLLWKNVSLYLVPSFLICFLILSCISSLCILEINPLAVASFADIFCHSEGYHSILFMVSFAVQKLLSSIRSQLFFVCLFVFISITLGGGSKKILLQFTSNNVLTMFSSKSSIVSGLMLRW